MSILSQQLKQGLVYSNLPQFKQKVNKAKKDIQAMIERSLSSYVALSWGKQSIVLSHLVFSVNKGIKHVHFTGIDAPLIADFNNVRDLFIEKFKIDYSEIIRELSLRDAILNFEKSNNFTGVFIGLCAYESKARRIVSTKIDENSILKVKQGLVRCYPIIKWTQEDLAAYIARESLPILRPYHRYGLEIRTSTGSKPGSYTERAVDLMNSIDAAEMRERWLSR